MKMSIKDFLGLEEKRIKTYHNGELIYIQIIGGHGSGKSTIVGEIKRKYGNNIKVLGKYVNSKTNDGYLTGGTDMFSMTSQQRFDYIKEQFLTDEPVIIAEGMFITWYKTFLSQYYTLQKLKNRKIYIILLECEYDELCKRIFKRSKGKEITEKRLNNITSKAKTAKSAYDKLVETADYKKVCFDYTDCKKLDEIVGYICNIIDEVLGITNNKH